MPVGRVLQELREAPRRLDGFPQGLAALHVTGRNAGQVVLVVAKTILHAPRVLLRLAHQFGTVLFGAHASYDRDAIADEIGRSTRGMM